MFERFTTQAREVVKQAQREARQLRHGWIGTEHVLLALLTNPDAPGVATLSRLGVTVESCRSAVAAVVGPGVGLGDEDTTALRVIGIDLDEVRRRTEEVFGEGALDVPVGEEYDAVDPRHDPRRFRLFGRRRRPRRAMPGHIPFAARAKKVLELSLREALALKDRHIGTEHIVLGLLRTDDKVATALFDRLGVEPSAAHGTVIADLRQAA